ncbi:MAG: ABC transporter substrate-binding protein [Treponema sp.]|jgi:putative spermidine/putrescine transport system substrate-binding protein|nr:ABC transporter substrate-binding protein [Treponema sp.]
MKKIYLALIVTASILIIGCGPRQIPSVQPTSFEEALATARGKTVTFFGWGGDHNINQWLDTVVADTLRERYDITLVRVSMGIGDILSKLMAERQAGSVSGDIDVVWINGENFYAALNAGLLWGPITGLVENMKYMDPDDPAIHYDFGTPVNGMQVPYGKAQMIFIGDTAVLDRFPASAAELLELARQNPGRFTYTAPPDFTGSAFVRNIISDVIGFDTFNNAPVDEQGLYEVIRPALDFLIELNPYLWEQGRTFPSNPAVLDAMFADGQVFMTVSYHPNHAAQRIAAGQFPPTAQAFLFDAGTKGNTHYMAIPFNAPNKDAALVLINHIISPEIQISKFDPRNWGDMPVFDINRISDEQRALLDSIYTGLGTIPPAELLARQIPEVRAPKIPIIDRLWLQHVAQ